MKNFSKLRETDGDITFEFEEGRNITVHKAILKAHSLKFAEMFANHFPGKIRVINFKFGTMEKVFNFLYSGKLEIVPEEVTDLLDCAKKLKIPVLESYLIQQSKEVMELNNFLSYYLIAKKENLEDLKTNSLKFFAE
jgi:hypothetical protein